MLKLRFIIIFLVCCHALVEFWHDGIDDKSPKKDRRRRDEKLDINVTGHIVNE